MNTAASTSPQHTLATTATTAGNSRMRLNHSPIVRAMLTNNRMTNCDDVSAMMKDCEASGSSDRICRTASRYLDICMTKDGRSWDLLCFSLLSCQDLSPLLRHLFTFLPWHGITIRKWNTCKSSILISTFGWVWCNHGGVSTKAWTGSFAIRWMVASYGILLVN